MAKSNKTWIQNALRSIGSASKATFKSITPNISNSASKVVESTKTLTKTMRGVSARKVARQLSQNQYVKIAQKALDQVKEDISSGNLYNETRDDSSEFDDFAKGFDELAAWGEDEESAITFNYIDNDSGSNEEPSMVANAIAESTNAQVKSAQANLDAMVGLSTSVITTVQNGFRESIGHLESIDSTLKAILEYQQSNTTEFYNVVTAAMEKIGSSVADDSATLNSDQDLFSSSGTLNTSSYKKYIVNNLKKVVDDSPAGAILPFLKDKGNLEMLVQDPVGSLTKGVIGGFIPKILEGTLKEVDKTFGELIPNLMIRMGQWAKDSSSGKIKSFIGNIFGIKQSTETKLNTKEITKDRAEFDQITRNTITQVLPKYARESTAYLREIARVVTKKDPNKLLDSQEIFDTKTNSYKTKSDITKQITDAMKDSVLEAFNSSDFGKVFSRVSGNLTKKDKEDFDSVLERFYVELANSDGMTVADYDLDNAESRINEVLERVGGGKNKNSKKLLRETIRQMYQSKTGIGSAAMAQLNAQRRWNEQKREFESNDDTYNLLSVGLGGDSDILEFVEQNQGNGAAQDVRRKRKEKEKKENEKLERENDKDIRKRFKGRVNKTVAGSIEDFKSAEQTRINKEIGSHGWASKMMFGEDFGSGIQTAGNHLKNSMFEIMRGNSSGAYSEFTSIFTDGMKHMWEGTKENFFKPLKESLFGKKDDNGDENESIIDATKNKFKDTYLQVLQAINGKDYVDSKGNLHKMDPEKESLVDKATNIFRTVRDGVKEKLFGKKEEKDKEDGSHGIVGSFTNTIKEGFRGWKEAIFGKSNDDDKNKIDKEAIKKAVIDHLPTAAAGTAAGGLIGALSGSSLLGMLIGGPVGGAALGFAGSFLARSSKFKDYLFGPKDENGERVGGFISKNTQEFVKKNKNLIAGGATLGVLKSFIFPTSGILTNLVGGPIAGAAFGIGASLLTKSKMWQHFLYGDEEKGTKGIVTAFKDIFKKKGENSEDKNTKGSIAKMLGMGAIGGVGLGLTASLIGKVGLLGSMVTPFGPIGAAVVGTAVGIAAGGSKFSKWLFGEKDEETGKRKGGLVNRFGNWMHTEILAPMKSKIQNITDDIKYTIRWSILENIRRPFVAIAEGLREKVSNAKEWVGNRIDRISTTFVTKFVKPFSENITKFIVTPVKKAISKVTDFVYAGIKTTVTLPFRIIGMVGKYVTSKLHKGLVSARKWVGRQIKRFFGLTFGITKALAKGAFKMISAPFKGLKSSIDKLKEKAAARRAEKREENKDKEDGKFTKFMKTVGGKLLSENFRENLSLRRERKDQKKENKDNAKQRANMDWNRIQMSRMLNYDVKYLTEENMKLAEEEARKQGKKIHWRGLHNMKYDTDPNTLLRQGKPTSEIVRDGDTSDNMDIRHLSEQHRTNTLLEEQNRILQNIQNGESTLTEDERREIEERARREALQQYADMGIDFDPETGTVNIHENGNSDNTGEQNHQGESEQQNSSEENSNQQNSENDSDQTNDQNNEMSLSDWINHYENRITEGFRNFRNSHSGLRTDGLSNMVGNGIDKLVSFFGGKGRTRAAGGPINANEPYIVGEGGNDTSGAEIVVPSQNSRVLSQSKGGIRTYISDIEERAVSRIQSVISKEDVDQETILTKTLDFVGNMADEVPVIGKILSKAIESLNDKLKGSNFNQEIASDGLVHAINSIRSTANLNRRIHNSGMDNIEFGGQRAEGGAVRKNAAYLVGDGGSDPSAAEIYIPRTSGKILSQRHGGINVNVVGFQPQAARQLEEVNNNRDKFKIVRNDDNKKKSNIIDIGSYKEMKKKREEAEKGKVERQQLEAINKSNEILSSIEKKNTKHHSIWSSIFSKKGLITMGLIVGGGLLIKNFPEVVSNLKSVATGIGEFLDWLFNRGGANKDGESMVESAERNFTNLRNAKQKLDDGDIIGAAEDFVLDEDGNYTHQSGARAGLLWTGGNKVLRKGSKVVNGAIKVGKGVVKVGKGTVKAGKAVGNKGIQIAADLGSTSAKKYLTNKRAAVVGADIAKTFAAKNADDIVVKVAATGAKQAAKEAGEAATKSTAKSVIKMISGFVDDIIKKVASKFGKEVGESALKNATKGMMKTVTNVLTKKFPKIAAKVTAITTGKAAAHGVTLGLDTIVLGAIGAVNGLTYAAQLFEVREEDVNWQMRTIAGVFGAIDGASIVGSIVNCVDQLISDITGFSFVSWIATALYGAIAPLTGGKTSEELNAAKAVFREDYDKYDEEVTQKQYETHKKAGLIDQSMTLDEFKEEAKAGNITVSKDSFKDFSAKENPSIGSRIGNFFSEQNRNAKIGFNGLKIYTDENGQQYIDTQDGNYVIKSASGENLGYVNKDNIDVSEMEETTKGGFKNIFGIFDGIKDGFNKVKDTATGFIDKGKEAVTGLNTGIDMLKRDYKDPNTDIRHYFGFNVNTVPEDNPMHGVVGTVLNMSKGLLLPGLIFNSITSGISREVKKFIDNIKQKVASVGSDIGSNMGRQWAIADTGDVNGLLAYEPTISEDNPISGIVGGLLAGSKYVYLPHAGVKYVGNKISEFIDDTKKSVSDVSRPFTEGLAKQAKLAEEGNVKELISYDPEIPDDNPLSWAWKLMLGITKIVYTTQAGFNYMVDIIKDAIPNIGGWILDRIDDIMDFGNEDTETSSGGNGKGIGGRGGSSNEQKNGFAYYSQEDSRWKNKSYVSNIANDGATMGDGGCGPTAMAMVAKQAANGNITPTGLADMASDAGFRDETGTNEKFISYAGDTLGIPHTDIENPSAKFIIENASPQRPIILNGVGGSGSAFTPGGHYVVAVGKDKDGNVLVNDPRGKEFSKAYSAEKLASESRKAWSFGGSGRIKRRKQRRKIGGRGVSGDWLSIVKSVKALVAQQHVNYSQGGKMTINYNGTQLEMRTDCSGYVTACLKLYGAIQMSENYNSQRFCQMNSPIEGFTAGGWPGWDGLAEGDIIAVDGHVEIFSSNTADGRHYVYNCGSTNAMSQPGPTPSSHKSYSVVWRPGNAGTGTNTVALSSDGNSSMSVDTSSNSSGNVLTRLGGLVSRFASRVVDGVLTGNWNTDLSENGGSTVSNNHSGDGRSFGSSGSVTAANLNPSASAQELFSYFVREGGMTKEGAAGLLGNLHAESGVEPIRLQNDLSADRAESVEYTKKVDSGEIPRGTGQRTNYTNAFVNDSKGYGLAQWTSAGRQAKLYDFAKSSGKSVGDLGVQGAFLLSELQQSYKPVYNVLTSSKDVREASNIVLDKFESPKEKGGPVQDQRAAFSMDMYNKYAKGTVSFENENQYTGYNPALAGGYGKRKNCAIKIGGRGTEDVMRVSNVDNGYNSIHKPYTQPKKQEITQKFDTSTLEGLLKKVIDVLQSIDGNTSKIEGLSGNTNNTINTGGNISVNALNGNNNSQQQLPTKDNRNAILAQRIARGI